MCFFSASGKPKDTAEYWSYIFPICAAVFAGATAFKERRKGLFYILALFFLFGMASFITIKDEDFVILPLSSTLRALIIAYHVGVLGWRALKPAFMARNWSIFLPELGQQIGLATLLGFACLYAATYLLKNHECITASDATAVTKCGHPWVIWWRSR